MLPRRWPAPTALALVLLAAPAGCGRPRVSTDGVAPTTSAARAESAVQSEEGEDSASSPGLLARVASALGFRRAPDDAAAYEGHDSRGIPHYATRTFTADEARVLRQAYGIEDPHRLYVSDSTAEGILKYDTRVKRCLDCYVNSYRVGFVSVRLPGESWEAAEQRVRATRVRELTGGALPASASLADLDPEVRPRAEELLAAARAHGFRVRVVGTYRSPLREASLMSEGGGRTHTLTSMHSYGRALDIVVDDGVLAHARTRADWIAFRRWASGHRLDDGESFRILGTPERTWDWPHLELPTERIGFRSIDAAVRRAQECLAPGASIPCDFPTHLPPGIGATTGR